MALFGKPSLQKRISLLVLAFLVLILVLFGWLGVDSLNRSSSDTLDERLTRAKAVAGYLDRDLEHILVNLKDQAEDFGAQLPAGGQFHASAKKLASTFSRLDISVPSIYLWDAQGHLVMAERAASPSEHVAGTGEVFPLGSVSQVLISPLLNDPLTGNPVVFASVPIGAPGPAVGALTVAIDIDASSITRIIEPITLGNTGYAEVMDSSGVVLARTDPGRTPDPFELSDHPEKFAALISDGRATVRTCHRCHGTLENPQRSSRDVLAFAPLQNASWGVAIRQSETEAFAIREQLKERLILLGAIFAIGAFVVVGMVTQGVVRPVKALTDAARRLAAGDYRAAVPVTGKDEIGQLGQSFSAMTKQLGKARDELVSRNRELASLNSIAATVAQSLDTREVLTRALRQVMELTRGSGGCVVLALEATGKAGIACRQGASSLFDCPRMGTSFECPCNRAPNLTETRLIDDPAQCPELARPGLAAEGIEGFVTVPLKSKGRGLGLLNFCVPPEGYYTEQDFKLLDAIGNYVGLAVDNAMLYQESRQKEKLRGELLGASISAQEEERKRLARELHDELGQTLTGVIMGIDSIEDGMKDEQDREKLSRTRLVTLRALQDLRKIIRGLRSAVLDELGLVAAIRSHAEEHLEEAGIEVKFEAEGMGHRLPADVETGLFRVAQEAVNNIVRHSGASKVRISLRADRTGVVLSVEDNGKGFDTQVFFANSEGKSLGILGMRERASLLGGTFNVASRQGQGTWIKVEIPIDWVEPAGESGKGGKGGPENASIDR